VRTPLLWVLLGVASLLTLACCIGLAVMPRPIERLHYVAPPTTIAAGLVTVALFLADPDADVGARAAFFTLTLVLMNGVATHATARAMRIRAHGTWLPVPGERVRVHRPDTGGDA